MSQNCECLKPVKKIAVRGLEFALDEDDLGGIGGGVDYSLEEQWTGRRWVDGKKIYQRSIRHHNLPNTAIVDVPHEIANIDTVVTLFGTCVDPRPEPSQVFFYTLPFIADPPLMIYVGASRTIVRFRTYTDRSYLKDAVVTIQYTCTDR